MKRKSPKRHRVKPHLRKNNPVREHARGRGFNPNKNITKTLISNPKKTLLKDYPHTPIRRLNRFQEVREALNEVDIRGARWNFAKEPWIELYHREGEAKELALEAILKKKGWRFHEADRSGYYLAKRGEILRIHSPHTALGARSHGIWQTSDKFTKEGVRITSDRLL